MAVVVSDNYLYSRNIPEMAGKTDNIKAVVACDKKCLIHTWSQTTAHKQEKTPTYWKNYNTLQLAVRSKISSKLLKLQAVCNTPIALISLCVLIIMKLKYNPAVRSNILSKLIFATSLLYHIFPTQP